MSLLFPQSKKLREFRYKPIYWDPEKERREEIIKRSKIKQGLLPPEAGYSSSMKGALTGDDGLRNFTTRHQRKAKSPSRLIILLIILLIIGYLLYFM
ncbi:MAG: hypothetical protein PHI48_00990 [Bacteroidales bacterium]|nr:hypothetical protein [Bacteroidales bacterium]MDD4821122.1 hypothetical protein [Bacteroidales bacterium]